MGKTETSVEALKKTIANEDPDSSVKFALTTFPINDLMNNSFIDLYPDVLDIIFYNPEIVQVLEKFGTSSGFICNLTSNKVIYSPQSH